MLFAQIDWSTATASIIGVLSVLGVAGRYLINFLEQQIKNFEACVKEMHEQQRSDAKANQEILLEIQRETLTVVSKVGNQVEGLERVIQERVPSESS